MSWLQKLFGRPETQTVPKAQATPQTTEAIQTKRPADESVADVKSKQGTSTSADSFAARCFAQEFAEQPDDRTFNSSPRFREILDPLNSGRADEAIAKAIALMPEFSDFDMIYSWASSGYIKKRDYDQAVAILKKGLASAKRKYLLLSKMGSLYFEKGDISEASFYWIQAILGQRSNPQDHNPYLYLIYVANALDRARVGSALMSTAYWRMALSMPNHSGSERRMASQTLPFPRDGPRI